MLALLNPSLNAIAVGRQAFDLDSIQDSGFRGVLTQEVKEKEQIKLNDRAIMDFFMGGPVLFMQHPRCFRVALD
jgi:hypothetical protein